MNKPGEGQNVVGAAALMVNPEGISSREGARYLVIDEKREGGPEMGYPQTVFAGGLERREVRLQNLLVTWKRKALIGPWNQFSAVNLRSSSNVNEGEVLCAFEL